MSTTITPLFSSPLYHTNIKNELDIQEVDAIFNNANLNKHELMLENIGNKFTCDQNILNANQVSTIYKAIKKHIDIYFYELLRAEKDIEIFITQSWINKSASGEYHQAHTHHNSFLSGTFYYKTNTNAGQLTFADPKYTPLEYRKQEYTAFNSSLWKVIPDEYDLILFPSYILHGVGINNSSNLRISLAFNTYLKGIINNKPTTSLTLN